MDWDGKGDIQSREYVCGFCGNLVASAKGYCTSRPVRDGHAFYHGYIYVCPHCGGPSFILGSTQIPGVPPGGEVQHLPEDIPSLYNEARQAVSVNAFTAAVLAGRKLLMNIAVSQGAKEGASFLSYVEHLANAGFVPPNGRAWVDHIRSKGNEVNHEIRLMDRDEAIELISFSEMLLKFVYEFPGRVLASKPVT